MRWVGKENTRWKDRHDGCSEMAVEVDAVTEEEEDGPRGRGSKDNIGGRRGRKTRVMNLQLEKKNDTRRGERRGERKGTTVKGQENVG